MWKKESYYNCSVEQRKLSSILVEKVVGLLNLCWRKSIDTNTKSSFSSQINILLCGDPGTAKSQLQQYVFRLVPRAQYTNGKGTSAVGLTAYVTKDPETRQLVLQTSVVDCLSMKLSRTFRFFAVVRWYLPITESVALMNSIKWTKVLVQFFTKSWSAENQTDF